jgi:integrase
MVDKKSLPYLYTKRDVFYFSKHVPKDIRAYYQRDRIVMCLKTKCPTLASTSSKTIMHKLEAYWVNLRFNNTEIPLKNLLVNHKETKSDTGIPTLSDSLEIYFKLKGHGKGDIFFRASRRAIKDVVSLLNDRPIDQYTTIDASKFRDHMLKRKLASSSVKRVFAIIRSIINITIREHGISCNNAFSRTFIPDLNDIKKRQPIPIETIINIQKECYQINDPNRWLIALISDTGMRLAEATGLLCSDFNLDETIPFVNITPHTSRRLKTKSSERQIPLVGASLWAAKQIIHYNNAKYAFPKYTNNQLCKTNSASAALNKWLNPRAPDGCVIHSFRHSMRDRLREVNCPTEMIDQIGGWSDNKVGSLYGNGYSLKRVSEELSKIVNY